MISEITMKVIFSSIIALACIIGLAVATGYGAGGYGMGGFGGGYGGGKGGYSKVIAMPYGGQGYGNRNGGGGNGSCKLAIVYDWRILERKEEKPKNQI